MDGADVQANAGFQSTRFGVSGVSLTRRLPPPRPAAPRAVVRHANRQHPTATGFVANVTFTRVVTGAVMLRPSFPD